MNCCWDSAGDDDIQVNDAPLPQYEHEKNI